MNVLLLLLKERLTASLPERQRNQVDFERPVYTAAAFYFAAKLSKVREDQPAGRGV